ncbi:MAG: rRNA maturation RNase YbeY [Pseudomonadota bacterium]
MMKNEGLVLSIDRDDDWPQEITDALILHAANAVSDKIDGTGQIDILLSGDDHVRALNTAWRGQDKPTNVLSFPMGEIDPSGTILLGDIVLARETVLREAEETGISSSHHVSHLIVHGILHLLGYDHQVDAEAAEMERLETEILAGLGIADPYADPPPETEVKPRHADA